VNRFADRIFGSPVPPEGLYHRLAFAVKSEGKKQDFGAEIYLADTIPGEKA